MSVIIRKCMGRFGNQLFPYTVGRIISEKLQYKLSGPTNSDPEFLLHKINLFYNNSDYQSFSEPIQQLGDHSKSNNLCHPDFDIFDVIKDKTPRCIILDGYFQRKKFLVPFREDIKKWLNPTKYNVSDNDIALHIRQGDLYTPNNCKHLLPIEYYEAAINSIPHYENITICTDSSDSQLVTYLRQKYNAKIFNGDEFESISFLSSHNNLILSQGTFSFWSGFLCNGSNIINAIPKTGWNSEADDVDVDLLLSGPNYKYIKL
jgi:Glycosyl transferase family 11